MRANCPLIKEPPCQDVNQVIANSQSVLSRTGGEGKCRIGEKNRGHRITVQVAATIACSKNKTEKVRTYDAETEYCDANVTVVTAPRAEVKNILGQGKSIVGTLFNYAV